MERLKLPDASVADKTCYRDVMLDSHWYEVEINWIVTHWVLVCEVALMRLYFKGHQLH